MGPALVKILGSWVEFLFHGNIYKPDIFLVGFCGLRHISVFIIRFSAQLTVL